ncbi:DNA-3-methyladenine glycosylase I [Candidatus Heimdallarchaeota archaeon B3_Heim]|nr:MAG: DNA-3-methyladenine glycosylase I [Candidatus Heimdallarchaeota archaeon B3_Heim]
MRNYHDEEWGVPVHDDRELFELLILEGAQAGLSWATILKRREGYRKAFVNFDINKVAQFSDKDFDHLIVNEAIIRNKLKVKSAINNAQRFIEVQNEFGSFNKYIWSFIDHKPIHNQFVSLSEIPASTPLSVRISKDLKKRGFNFIGPTICYAYMQSIGMVNDHVVNCFRYNTIKNME